MTMAEDWIDTGVTSNMSLGSMVPIRLGSMSIAIYNVEGVIYATDNICTHAYAVLTDGWLDGDVIECPLHGGRFKVKTGEALGDPVMCNLRTFPVRVHDGVIQIKAAPPVGNETSSAGNDANCLR